MLVIITLCSIFLYSIVIIFYYLSMFSHSHAFMFCLMFKERQVWSLSNQSA